MGRNMRYAKTSPKPKKARTTDRKDSVSPIKTKNWPGLPGGTQRRKLNHGMKPLKHGPADRGI